MCVSVSVGVCMFCAMHCSVDSQVLHHGRMWFPLWLDVLHHTNAALLVLNEVVDSMDCQKKGMSCLFKDITRMFTAKNNAL